jgi:pimeloyl-ACP methyl ester carboxylesterase
MQEFSIKNRYSLDIVGNVSVANNSIGCSFVLHGLGGTMDQLHILALADVLLSNKYTVVNFDATNSIGKSGGNYENATMQLHYEDLVDVISWAKSQVWYKEPFVLSGHSLGAYAVLQYAEDYPNEVKALFPFAPVVSGDLSMKASSKSEPEELILWRETGWTVRVSNSKPGIELRLPWSHMEERLTHDLRKKANNITMPVLIIVGGKDWRTPPEHQELLLNSLPKNTQKEMHVVKDAPHTFRTEEHIDQLKNIFNDWLKRIK